MSAPGPPVPVSGVDRHGFWLRTLRMWDLVLVAMLAVYAVAVLVDTMPPARKAVALGTLAVLGLAYLLVGRRGAVRGDPRLADAYLVLLVVVVVVQVAMGGIGSVLLFVAFSHIWFFSRHRWAGVAWCTVLTVGIVAAAATRLGTDLQATAEIGAQFGVALVFAIVLGLWVTQVAEQSEERAYLLEELRAAQDELASSHHASGVLAERARLAGEIHDTLAQGFTSVVMLAQAASAEIEHGRTDQARRRVGQMEQVARDNLAEARALVAAFAPPDLAAGGLADALVRLGRRFGDETGVHVDVEADDDGIGREAQVVLLRAAQEALANVRKHADASTVVLRLRRDAGGARLEVVDDGRGLPADAAEGNGLRGMRARAGASGGTLDVAPGPGRGTQVLLQLPSAALVAGAVPGASPGGGTAVEEAS
ncbi:sensor histidine kinase [Cellulomonas oligotrophica]|uniref:Signal transduction histidine kinase n=1 Tax=Cellulomonas oligotrophica TaxID=931536 RepID=A0A7Y9FGG2_9CELL|nr:sensor histidine kinase [Cellulomonas oligotrophica]NYD85531.1 signal transduction histidine kinase [Cellulomonas oligotrophica]GIG31460.1 two-component sensor histidine kinase [Cellulomonas oligotrophica]